jgi:hypothetical protein
MVTAGALVLASTHTGSILISEPHIALSASYAAMLGVTVVTIGFRNGFGYSLLTCMLGFVGGSRYAVWQGARPDWVLVSYGYVAASAVGLVISWLVERQDALHFFQSILLASEAEERLRLNQQLEAMSRTDSLSGLANRRSFDDTLEAEWARMRRERAPLSLVFVDVDHFKRFNDANGHRAGDACLRAVGQALLTWGAAAGRHGGPLWRRRVRAPAAEDRPRRRRGRGAPRARGHRRALPPARRLPYSESRDHQRGGGSRSTRLRAGGPAPGGDGRRVPLPSQEPRAALRVRVRAARRLTPSADASAEHHAHRRSELSHGVVVSPP